MILREQCGAKPFLWIGLFLAGCSWYSSEGGSTKSMTAVQHLKLGTASEDEGDYKTALTHYQLALEKDSEELQALVNLGNVYTHLKQYPRAEVFYRQALQKDPHHPMANNNLAWVMVIQGSNLSEAEILINRAMFADPDHVSIYFDTLAHLYLRENRYRDALNSVQAAENHLPSDDLELRDHIARTRSVINRVLENSSGTNLPASVSDDHPEVSP